MLIYRFGRVRALLSWANYFLLEPGLNGIPIYSYTLLPWPYLATRPFALVARRGAYPVTPGQAAAVSSSDSLRYYVKTLELRSQRSLLYLPLAHLHRVVNGRRETKALERNNKVHF